jgi:hypothetical protein
MVIILSLIEDAMKSKKGGRLSRMRDFLPPFAPLLC